jgi:phosphoribosylamine---glycine ligase
MFHAGFMLTASGPVVLEYNCRFGDPEAQALLPLLDTDLLDIFQACINGGLDADMVRWKEHLHACAVVCAPSGYPSLHATGHVIHGLDDARRLENVIVYHGGTACRSVEAKHGERNGVATPSAFEVVTTGGRTLAITGIGTSVRQAVQAAYLGVSKVSFQNMHTRTDIAHR